MPHGFSFPKGLILQGLFLCCLAVPSCDATIHKDYPDGYVEKISFQGVPENWALAERSREICNKLYPKVIAYLGSFEASAPKRFSLAFVNSIHSRESWKIPARTRYRTIYLDLDWMSENPVYLDFILIHEMVHVAQDYGWQPFAKTPSYWVEGLAHYVPFQLGYGQGTFYPSPTLDSPHYKSGYSGAAAFLLFLESRYGNRVITELHAALKNGRYSDALFANLTGRSLDALWTDYRSSHDFPTPAKVTIHLYDLIGLTGDESPSIVRGRLEKYLRREYSKRDLESLELFLGYEKGKAPVDVFPRYALYVYESSPGGRLTVEATKYFAEAASTGQLPWIGKADLRNVSVFLPEAGYSDEFPIRRVFYFGKKADPFLCHYVIEKSSPGMPWHLRNAWRTAADGSVVERR